MKCTYGESSGNRVKTITLFFFLIASMACSVAENKELLGTYFVNYRCGGSESLELGADGTYKQVVVIDPKYLGPPETKKTSGTLIHKGRWDYDPKAQKVVLHDALNVVVFADHLNPNCDIPINGVVVLDVIHILPWSPIKLTTAYEGEYFLPIRGRE